MGGRGFLRRAPGGLLGVVPVDVVAADWGGGGVVGGRAVSGPEVVWGPAEGCALPPPTPPSAFVSGFVWLSYDFRLP